jgi:hypothetical protein
MVFKSRKAFEETPTRMSIKINRLEEGHNSYPLVCRRLAETVSLQTRQICYVLSINNSRFAEFLPLIYPPELEVKEATDTASSASFLDLYLEFEDSGRIFS